MKYRTLIIGTLIAMSFSIAIGQSKKITNNSFLETSHHLDSTASAAYLYSGFKVKFVDKTDRYYLEMDYHFRIKIFNEDGEDYGKFQIPIYRDGSAREKVTNIKAKTYNYENGKIVETSLSKKNVYEEETTENWKLVKFALPNVKAGSVIDVKYRVTSPYIYTIPTWEFQRDIPTDHSHYEIIVPGKFGITPIPAGTIKWYRNERQISSSAHNNREITYESKNIPAFKDDEYILNEDDYKSSLKYEIHSYIYNDGRTKYFSKDWPTIGDNLLSSESFGKMIKKKIKALDPIVEEAKGLPMEERVYFIHDHIRKNFNWNKRFGIRSDVGFKKMMETKTGNIGDLNLLLLNLLKKAGVEAYPVATKRRFSGLLNQYFPSLSELDYLLVQTTVKGKTILIDASSKYVPIGMLPTRAINISALLIEKGKSEIIVLNNPNIYHSVSISDIILDTDDLSLQFTGDSRRSKFAGVKYRIEIDEYEEDEDNQDVESSEEEVEDNDEYSDEDEYEEDEEEVEELREDEYNVISVEELDDIYKPVKIKFEEIKYQSVQGIGDKLFIDCDFNEGVGKNPFTEEDRDYPVFYNQLNDIRRVMNLNIPEGYELVSVPEKLVMSTEDKKATFIYEAKQIEGKLNVVFYLKIASDIFLAQDYKSLKNFYDQIIKKQKEKIVLEKIG